jgi:hypothetical protein
MPELNRASLQPRSNRALTIGIALTAVVSTAVVTNIALTKDEAAAAPAPAKPITPTLLPIPAPQVIVLPTPLAPPVPPPVAESPPPRAATPHLDARCVAGIGGENPACAWDQGFPALSADGTMIAIEYTPEDGMRGLPGLAIRFVTVGSSRVVRDVPLLTPGEYEPSENSPQVPELLAKLTVRVAKAQRLLDAGGYRTMTRLEVQEGGGGPVVDGLRVETAEDSVRVIDAAKNRVIWQRRFDVDAQFTSQASLPDGENCTPSREHTEGIAWDAKTRTILAEILYSGGGDSCDGTPIDYVTRLP